ncbi:hypothetical protein [Streptomyces formicae]
MGEALFAVSASTGAVWCAVLPDAFLGIAPEAHRVLVEPLFPQWADAVTGDGWAKVTAASVTAVGIRQGSQKVR